jgi:hypothetical protein
MAYLLPPTPPPENGEEKHELLSFDTSPARRFTSNHLTKSLYTSIKSIIYFLLPSFLASDSQILQFQPYTPGSTLYLSSLRGIAAFLVFFYHFFVTYIQGALESWSPVRYPNLVMVFFVVSGFALSCKPVKILYQQNQGQGGHKAFVETIASSVLRRYLRLILPCAGAFVFIHGLRISGAMDLYGKEFGAGSKDAKGHAHKYPPKSPDGVYGQAVIMMHDFWGFAVDRTIFNKEFEYTTDVGLHCFVKARSVLTKGRIICGRYLSSIRSR